MSSCTWLGGQVCSVGMHEHAMQIGPASRHALTQAERLLWYASIGSLLMLSGLFFVHVSGRFSGVHESLHVGCMSPCTVMPIDEPRHPSGPLSQVVLVTNALQYLPHADSIIWMEDGAIKGQGTYTQLVEQGLNIAELVHLEVRGAHCMGWRPSPTAIFDTVVYGTIQNQCSFVASSVCVTSRTALDT